MKDKILLFIIGLLVGSIITASGFLIYQNTNQTASGEQMQIMERPDGNNTPPEMLNGGMPGGNSESSNVSHTGATEISSDTTNNGEAYSSTTGSENALLVTGDSYISALENADSSNSNINFISQ